MPGTITNGNTPQGLFTIVGTVNATDIWIGPTPALESEVPKEASVADYEHGAATTPATDWTEDRYWSFFPASWRGYAPMREVWLAGLAGRDGEDDRNFGVVNVRELRDRLQRDFRELARETNSDN